MVEKHRDILANDWEIDFKSFIGINPFDLNKRGKRLPSSGIFVTAELSKGFRFNGEIVSAGGTVTTYPYEDMSNYLFMPFMRDQTYFEAKFRHFDRDRQLEIEYVNLHDVRKKDRHKYANQNPTSQYFQTDGWITEEKLKTPSKGNLIIRKGPKIIIDEYSHSFEENKNVIFYIFRLLSYFEIADIEGLVKFTQGVFEEAMKLPKEDVDLIMSKASRKLQAA